METEEVDCVEVGVVELELELELELDVEGSVVVVSVGLEGSTKNIFRDLKKFHDIKLTFMFFRSSFGTADYRQGLILKLIRRCTDDIFSGIWKKMACA